MKIGDISKKLAKFAEEFAKFTPGIRRARAWAPGPDPWGPRYRWGLGTSGDTSYEFTDILRIHRNPTNSQTSCEFTKIQRIHKHIDQQIKNLENLEIEIRTSG